MSQRVVNPIFQLSDIPIRDTSILSQDYVKLFDVNASRNPGSEQESFTFRCQDLNGHYLPSRALLVLKFRIVTNDADSTPYRNKEPASVVNHAGAIFSRACYKLNGMILEEITQHLEHRVNVDAVTQYSSDYIKSVGAHMLIFKDDGTLPIIIPEINDMSDEYVCLEE